MGQTMYNGQLVQTEDCTPTWEAALPIYLTAYENGNRVALSELTRMAKSLDEKNEHVKELCAKINELNETIEIMDDEKNILASKTYDLEKQLEKLTQENESYKKVNKVMIDLCNKHGIEAISYQQMIKNLDARLDNLETELELLKNAQE